MGLKTTFAFAKLCKAWMHVNLEIVDNVREALSRGVKYRVVLEKPDGELSFPKELKYILSHPNYEVRLINAYSA